MLSMWTSSIHNDFVEVFENFRSTFVLDLNTSPVSNKEGGSLSAINRRLQIILSLKIIYKKKKLYFAFLSIFWLNFSILFLQSNIFSRIHKKVK